MIFISFFNNIHVWVWHVGVVCPGFDFPKVGGYNYDCGGGACRGAEFPQVGHVRLHYTNNVTCQLNHFFCVSHR